MSEPLSPAAQAVLDAFLDTPGEVPMPMWDYGRDLAAALRSVADQVAPACRVATGGDYASGANNERIVIRNQLFAIAAELEAQP